MIDALIQQLQDTNPAVRRQAIVALGRTKDPAALPALAGVFRGDPDPELRELARRAGVYIRQNSGGAAPAPTQAAPTTPTAPPRRSGAIIRPLDENEPAPEPAPPARLSVAVDLSAMAAASSQGDAAESASTEISDVQRGLVRGREYFVSKENKDRAKGYLERALSDQLADKNDKAMKSIAQALVLNPNLINDPYFNSVAASITGREGDEAIQMIVATSDRRQFIKGAQAQQKEKRKVRHLEKASRSSSRAVGFEMIIYLLTVILGPTLVQLIFIQTTLNFLQGAIEANPSLAGELTTTIEESAQALSLSGALTYLLTALVSAAVGFFGLIILTGLIHVLSTRLLGGYGTWNHLMDSLLIYFNRYLPLYFFLLCLVAGSYFALFPLSNCLLLPAFGLTWYITYGSFQIVGEAYDFGMLRGCLAYYLSITVVAAISFIAITLVAQAAVNVLPGFMSGL